MRVRRRRTSPAQQQAGFARTAYEAGQHSVQWAARGLASGVYFYRLQTGNYVETKKTEIL